MSQLASERLERELGPVEKVRLKIHTLMCGACRRYNTNISKLHQALRLKREHTHCEAILPQDKRKKIENSLQDLSSKP